MRRLARLVALLVALLPGAARADAQTARALRALETSPSLKVRSQAALVLGQLRAVEAAPALRRAATADPAPAVRLAAVAALARLGPGEAGATLEAVSRGDADPAVRAAAAEALAAQKAPAATPGGIAVSLEEAVGSGGGPAERAALREALGRWLARAGFRVQEGGALRLKPSIAALDLERAGERTVVAVRAELVAVEGGGRMAAMLEGRARAAVTGRLGDRELAAVSAQAVDAVARVLADDLAARLAER